MVFGSTLSYIVASLLAALLALALGSIVQAVVEMKVYLVICAVVPFLIILVLGFTKNPMNVDNIAAYADAQSKLIVNIPNKTNLKDGQTVATNPKDTLGYKNLEKVHQSIKRKKTICYI